MTIPERDLASSVRKRTPFGSLEQEAFLNLMRAHSRLLGPFDRLFREHSVSMPLYNILRILAGHKHGDAADGTEHRGVPVLRIGEQMVTREPDMTRLVNRLEKLGLASRQRCNDDRRVVRVRITDEGEALLARLRPEVDRLHETQFDALRPEELRTLNSLLFRASEQAAETTERND